MELKFRRKPGIIEQSGLRSVMDITQDSGSCNGGSTPSGDILLKK